MELVRRLANRTSRPWWHTAADRCGTASDRGVRLPHQGRRDGDAPRTAMNGQTLAAASWFGGVAKRPGCGRGSAVARWTHGGSVGLQTVVTRCGRGDAARRGEEEQVGEDAARACGVHGHDITVAEGAVVVGVLVVAAAWLRRGRVRGGVKRVRAVERTGSELWEARTRRARTSGTWQRACGGALDGKEHGGERTASRGSAAPVLCREDRGGFGCVASWTEHNEQTARRRGLAKRSRSSWRSARQGRVGRKQPATMASARGRGGHGWLHDAE